jgi:hypothetical protein
MPREWEECIKEGESLYQYMVEHFEEMFNGNEIKHFSIWYATWWMQSYYHNVQEKYRKEIQEELITWIRKEKEIGHLEESLFWKPFRDSDSFCDIYQGYKKLFLYQNYYFQLIIQSECGECVYCEKGENQIHFELALYGWKDDSDLVQPYNELIIGTDMLMPSKSWNSK